MSSYNIYVITAKGQAMKVGIATDVRARVQELQVGNHERLRVSAVFQGFSFKQARHIENQCHKEMKQRQWHRRGEWFIPKVRECTKLLKSLTNNAPMLSRKQYEARY